MSIDQQRYIRGISGVAVNAVEIHEKDFLEKVNINHLQDHLKVLLLSDLLTVSYFFLYRSK